MTPKPVHALPEVAGDLLAAIAHYQSWRTDGREQLLKKYEAAVGLIGGNPAQFPRKHGEIRHVMLRQSYYLVYFLSERDRALVLAVLDGRRNPHAIQAIVTGRQRRWPKP